MMELSNEKPGRINFLCLTFTNNCTDRPSDSYGWLVCFVFRQYGQEFPAIAIDSWSGKLYSIYITNSNHSDWQS